MPQQQRCLQEGCSGTLRQGAAEGGKTPYFCDTCGSKHVLGAHEELKLVSRR
ncbi:MAG: hypothetical protein WC858_03160 [Parcubacteria group bacterium]